MTTWSTGVVVAGASGSLGAPPVLAATLGVAGALVAAAALTYGERVGAAVAGWYRAHVAAVGVWSLVAIYAGFAAVLAWIRWGS